MPDFHGRRQTPASKLINAGVDIVAISKRFGHASPDATLRVIAHLVPHNDKAATAIDAALAGAAGS